MEWVKLDSTYYLDVAIVRAGEAAEVLFVRAMAYCGDQENDGLVEREILPRLCPQRGPSRAAALVREGLWEVVPEGWRFVSWRRHQKTKEQMDASRESGRIRQKRHRDGVSDGVTNALVTEQRRGEERRTAAATPPLTLDPMLAGLQAAMHRYTKLRHIRFDATPAEKVAEIRDLIALHGDERLVEIALKAPEDVAHVGWFLGSWRALPAPGKRLAAVEQRFCTTHDWIRLNTSGACTACASERLAEGATS